MPSSRRQFLIATAASLLSACRVLAQASGTRRLLTAPTPDAWHGVLGALVVTILPFEHPRFPKVTPREVHDEIRRLFPIDDDPDFATLPRATMLFDAVGAFGVPPAPLVDDQLRDFEKSRLSKEASASALDLAQARDRASFARYASRWGTADFVDQSLDARRAYLALWSESEFVTRRRFYRGVKSLVCISAYSMRPMWSTVGYEGPLLERG